MDQYFTELATAFVRGRLQNKFATLDQGREAGLRLYKFKAGKPLPRVQKVIGILRGLAPQQLMDVGSGRGAFLWPLMSALPDLRVTSIELSEQRAADIAAVRMGGISRLNIVRMDAESMAFAPQSFDVVTMLEVLEHMPNPLAALQCAVNIARHFVVISVPSVRDDNPEHIHLFSVSQLQKMAEDAGGHRITIEHVLNHRIAVIRVKP